MNINNLTLEEQATNFETMQHIHLVQHWIHEIILLLLERAEKHDASKLEHPEVKDFTEKTPSLNGLTFGSAEYFAQLKEFQPTLDHHYANNRHHPQFFIQNERWLPVVGFEGIYEISDFGNLKSIARIAERDSPQGDMFLSGQYIKQYLTPDGYCRAQLSSQGKDKNFFLHRLVAEAFIINPQNKPEVNHIDGCKTNNKVGNLEWATESENAIHSYKLGLRKPSVKYVVSCDELEIVTFGCLSMEMELRARGYEKAAASSIWRCINHGGKHLDLSFVGTRFEEWMRSPVNDMNLVDLIEMFADWNASSKRHKDGNLRKSIEINASRFNINPQLVKILENSIDLFDA